MLETVQGQLFVENQTDLCEIARKYATDKVKPHKHNYTPVYEHLFRSKRKTAKKMLEIGTGSVANGQMVHVWGHGYKTGASLRMWRDYFNKVHVFAIDIYPEGMVDDEERITTFVCDQSNKEHLQDLTKKVGELDIVVDDGSHNNLHQVISLVNLLPSLKKDGLYCIEDCTPNMLSPLTLRNLCEQVAGENWWINFCNKYKVTYYDQRPSNPSAEDDIILVVQRK